MALISYQHNANTTAVLTFEESMKKLEEMAEKIKSEETTLEEAIAYYEEGIKCYRQCSNILENAEQKIQIYGQDYQDAEE